MRAIVRTEYGGPDVARLVDTPVPEPREGEVRVRVEAAGVDIGVWHLMAGLPLMVRPALGLPRPRLAGLGSELAGVVDAVGPAVDRFRPGDRVFGTGSGTFAEFAIAKQKHLVPLPDDVTAPSAAAAAVSGVTAWQALGSSPAVRVLVLGASGGVGSFAVQLAKARGSHVTGVASTRKLEFVRSLGTDEVVDYTTTDPVAGSARYDLILEMGGRRKHSALRRALTPGGRAVIVGGEGGGRLTGGFLKNLVAGRGVKGLVSSTTIEALQGIASALADRSVVPAIDEVLALADAPEALRRVEAGQVRGKLVLDPRR